MSLPPIVIFPPTPMMIGPGGGATGMAVPCRLTACGELEVLLTTLTIPRWTFEIQTLGSLGSVCPHRTSGEKVTVAEQLEP